MILLDQPYVSDLLRRTVLDHELPLVLTAAARDLGFSHAPGALSEQAAIDRLRADPQTPVLTNSENAIGWVAANLGFTGLPTAIDLFKNKLKFRHLLRDLYPDFRFREVSPDAVDRLDPDAIGHPFVIKPAVGFFSLGVQVVSSPADWPAARLSLQRHLLAPARNPYPQEVLDSTSLILEEIISGTEYAVDAYYDAEGRPVITNILQHLFSAEDDVSDRVYLTGEEIVTGNLQRFTAFLAQVGRLAGLRNFPVHVEVRVDRAGRIVPIEFNPLRFGGWCTTADLTIMGYGFNPYLAFLDGARPDWPAIFASRRNRLYSIIVLDNSTGLEASRIKEFDLTGLAGRFINPLEIRKVDHRKYGVFGFLFTETPADRRDELEAILHSDLREFVTIQSAG
jgi:hypothetical protein